ncbi:MAG TPA: DUF421 domain-containing protein [Pyrinomonadaceae bacterium]|nr:DUF421 domain-containing protein [Pyrinomonadaceae bacterium]
MDELIKTLTNSCTASGENCLWLLNIFPILGIIFRTLAVYIVVLLMLRFAGKREVGQMTPFDFVLLLLLSNSVQNAMTGGDNSLNGGIVAAVVLVVLNYGVNFFAWKSRKVRKFIEGKPTILVYKGKIIEENMESERITNDQLHEAFREHSIVEVEKVGLAVLEVDGSISVLKKDDLPESYVPHHRLKYLKRT